MDKTTFIKSFLYSILIFLAIVIFIFFQMGERGLYSNVYSPIIWLGLLITALLFTVHEKQRVKARGERIQTVFIVVLVILIVYFLSGLLTGYANTPYNTSLNGILRNLWIIVFVDIAKIYFRATIVHFSQKRFIYYFIITCLFILVDTGIYSFINQATTPVATFTNFFLILFPIIIKNIVLTYLIVSSGFFTALTYVLPRSIVFILVPVFPDYDWFLIAIKEVVFALAIYASINYINIQKTIRLSRRKIKKSKPIFVLPVIIFVILLAAFMVGVFKYSPLGIMSNSMFPNIQRGDVVIVRDVPIEKMQKLEKNDIIKFGYEGSYIVHRIIDVIEDEKGIWFQTQGDNNNAPDRNLVHQSQVFGVVVGRIAKVGYPSVWLSEYFNTSRPNIEMQ